MSKICPVCEWRECVVQGAGKYAPTCAPCAWERITAPKPLPVVVTKHYPQKTAPAPKKRPKPRKTTKAHLHTFNPQKARQYAIIADAVARAKERLAQKLEAV